MKKNKIDLDFVFFTLSWCFTAIQSTAWKNVESFSCITELVKITILKYKSLKTTVEIIIELGSSCFYSYRIKKGQTEYGTVPTGKYTVGFWLKLPD